MGLKPGKKRGIAIIPTLLTLSNGFCGFTAIAKSIDAAMLGNSPMFSEKLIQAAWLIFLAMVFDALDGRVARLTNQTSEFGEQLDSFTDIISFGIAPAIMVKVIYENCMVQASVYFSPKLSLLLCGLYVTCAVLRLARFTMDTSPEDSSHKIFYGLPTPAAAAVVASTVLFLYNGKDNAILPFIEDPAIILGIKKAMLFIPPLLGLLMISKIKYIHFFNRFVRGRKTFNYLVQGILALFVIAFCYEWALLLCFLIYTFWGPVAALIQSSHNIIKGKGKKDGHSKSETPPDNIE